MMGRRVISTGSSLTEIGVSEEEVPGIGEVVLEPHGDGMGAETLMMSLVIHIGEVVKVINLAAAGLEQEDSVGMIGQLEVDDQAGLHLQTG